MRLMDEPNKYLALCLDPVHVGTGGYRLGRVDLSIVREPASGIPKVPGTSLAGVVRAYAEKAREKDKSLPDIDTVFGTAEGEKGKQGMVRFFDVQVVLFPVNSHLGTVWVSTVERLLAWDFFSGDMKEDWRQATEHEDKIIPLKGLAGGKPVQLGWLLLEAVKSVGQDKSIILPKSLSFIKNVGAVSDKLFYHLVNDHLEVRTSVSIDRATGAAKTGALFTYEAIPRATVLGFEVVVDERRSADVTVEKVERLLGQALRTLKLLGIGGMGTRGFGRLEVLSSDRNGGM
jgi:CRISPR-associated protein Cmr4